ncbi:DUF4097 family beta strand repeat-containing protein [Chengkuizengella sediminis]|uniref:DUF4097 family beta strand repeat-containing protein n=1 Tax=Chengkuizengella sediminis TaxID=1885917 RepID=UPI00138A280D|nr:DUF4097 family beta strand repeat-containing protein [Chengkuizengella sediminis]NDI36119.1 DUF4097 domain-containing protein [Chengkuizengella sediminis]
MIKVGRYTAALLLVLVGAALLMDQTRDTTYVEEIIQWWPFIIISFGIEYLLFQLKNNNDRDVKIDIKSVILSLIIVLALSGLTSGFPVSVLNQLEWVNYRSATENDMKFEKEAEMISFSENTNKLYIENLNGKIDIKPTDQQDFKFETTIYVSKMDQENAKKIVNESKLEWSEGNTLQVFAKGKEYYKFGLKYKPKINLVIHVPESRAIDIQLKMKNGSSIVTDVSVLNYLEVDTTNGDIHITNIDGKVIANTTNGNIEVYSIGGNTVLDTTNGNVFAKDIVGNFSADTTNGKIEGEMIDGKVEADTTNGSITLVEVYDEVTADTTNGGIKVKSQVVDGSWYLDTTNQSIEVILPENEDFTFRAESNAGGFSSDFPFYIDKKLMGGIVGTGEHKIAAYTSNGSVIVKKWDLEL